MTESSRVPTGSAALDKILGGGLPADCVYLVEGTPGAGKTTLALQFLLEGHRRGEATLYVTLSETINELTVVALSHEWDLSGVSIFDLTSAEEILGDAQQQSILHSYEVELGGTIDLIKAQVERIKPRRVVFDSLSELRLIAQEPLHYRRQILLLKQYFAGKNITVLFLDDLTTSVGLRDNHLHSLCHGVITLERLTLDFGAARRRLQVQKMRGVNFVAGYHDFVIRKGGLQIFPRLIASEHHSTFIGEPMPSGVAELDAMLNGGPARGTCTLLTGPAGGGKTSLALQYVAEACRRGEHCVIYEFDERIGTMMTRAKAFGLDLENCVESGHLTIRQIDPAEISPGEFTALVRTEVEQLSSRVVVIDSLNGYLAAMAQENHLILQLRELLSYLNQAGTVTFLINPQQGFFGSMSTNGLDASYISDTIILLRFFEAEGRIRKAISVVKNRSGPHEDAIREFRLDQLGIRVGEPLSNFKGVLTGTPEFVGGDKSLMEDRTEVGSG